MTTPLSADQSSTHLASAQAVLPALGGKLRVSCALRVARIKPGNKPPALVAFDFRDGDGQKIPGEVPALSFSGNYGPFSYVGEGGEMGQIRFELRVAPPQGAREVHLTLHRWYAQEVEVEQALSAEWVENPSIELHHGGGEATPRCILSVGLETGDEVDPRQPPALASIIYFGADGQRLKGPFPGISHSDQYGPFIYLGKKGAKGELFCEVEVPYPPQAARLETELTPYGAKSVVFDDPLLSIANRRESNRDLDFLAEVTTPVEAGESYDLLLRWSGEQEPVLYSTLVVPRFYDEGGVLVAPPSDLTPSEKLGPYRYFSPSADAPETVPGGCKQVLASLTAPAKAVTMVAEVRRWQVQGDFGEVTTEVRSLAAPELISARGEFDHRLLPAELLLLGSLKASGEMRQRAGVIEIIFQTAQGVPLLEHAAGLEKSDRFFNYAPLHRTNEDGVIPLRLSFRPPAGAQRVVWRLRPEPGQALEPLGALELVPFLSSREARLAALPAEAVALNDVTPGEQGVLRAALPEAGVWEEIVNGALTLLGEALSSLEPNGWIALEGEVCLERRQPASAQLAIYPVYFDSRGMLVEADSLPGTTAFPNGGALRYATSGSLPAGRIAFRECFASPPGAAFAAFYLLALDRRAEYELASLKVSAIEPDAVHNGLNTANMDRAQIEAQLKLVELTRDVHAQRKLAVALSSLVPTDLKLAQRARVFTDYLRDLSPDWLPALPPQPGYEPDPAEILHLFKVIYPDESTGGAVRSTAIVEAQAARGLRPVVCMPLNSLPARQAELSKPVGDGIRTLERNGVSVCYPVYPGLKRQQIAPADLLTIEAALWSRAMQGRRIGLIHAASGFRGYDNALKGIALARAYNLPFLYEVRSFHEHTWRKVDAPQMGHSVTALRMAQENRCMAQADAVVTISQVMVANLVERGVPQERLFFVPNAIDPMFETLPSTREVARLRHEKGVLGKTTLGYISNFSQREGHRVLLDAFTRLVARGHDLYLVMAGDGPEHAPIQEEVRQRGLASRVVMPGNVDHSQIRTWYHAIDLFVVPRIADFASDYVTPLKPYEAMSQGVPVIMSERPVTAEIAGESHERASVFPAGDSVALAELVEAELADAPRLEARARLARDWVMAERVWSSVVCRYDEAYEAARRFHATRNTGGAR